MNRTRNIRYIETTATADEPQPDRNPQKAVIVVDGATEITVYGIGCGSYQLRIRNIELGMPGNNPEDAIHGFAPDASFWGKSLVWAEPITIGHLVMDVIDNQ
jgi:hypothetical protein